jgi:hypothetical protein
MNEHTKLEYNAYLWTLTALVVVFFGSMGFAAAVPTIIGKIEAFGLGTITGGLIGLLRMPRQQAPTQRDSTLDLSGAEQEQ